MFNNPKLRKTLNKSKFSAADSIADIIIKILVASIALTLFFVMLFALWSIPALLCIWAINLLFHTGIEFTVWNVVAAIVILAILNSGRRSSSSK